MRQSLFLDKKIELTPLGRRGTWFLISLYVVFLISLCWTPQNWSIAGVQTPNIIQAGRLVFLLVPFNSLVALGELDSLWEIVWVVGQNVTNIFLLFPLILGLLALFPDLRQVKKVVITSFAISLTIEVGQLLLDLLMDANRVFELDDLWTNTLGGYLAYQCYIFWVMKWRKR